MARFTQEQQTELRQAIEVLKKYDLVPHCRKCGVHHAEDSNSCDGAFHQQEEKQFISDVIENVYWTTHTYGGPT